MTPHNKNKGNKGERKESLDFPLPRTTAFATTPFLLPLFCLLFLSFFFFYSIIIFILYFCILRLFHFDIMPPPSQFIEIMSRYVHDDALFLAPKTKPVPLAFYPILISRLAGQRMPNDQQKDRPSGFKPPIPHHFPPPLIIL